MMMKKIKYLFSFLITGIVLTSCGNDDDNRIVVRDRGEVYTEDLVKLQDYLNTHFYNYEEFAANPAGADFEIAFDTIADVNASKTPLASQVVSKVLNRDGIDYTYYTLNVRQGGGVARPTFADSTLVSYEGRLLDNTVFDSSTNSFWFDLPNVVDGFSAGIIELNEAASIISNGDGTLSYTDSGIGAVFMPSGLAYFNRIQSIIPQYSPLIFTYQLRKVKTTDHDNDGILSKFEDLDGDQDVRSPEDRDNTDNDRVNGGYNYLDADDDGDGVPTLFENPDPNGDGDPSDAEDLDGDGIPGYLDANEVNIDLDNDGIQNRFEQPDPNNNGNPGDARDTDNDGIPDYLDDDDDGDGIPTSQENADPNNNGNPVDALDTDGDGIPDYLDADS
jgi:FKBP-type peptidyl-prolyl cis-trans isomerase FkpA